ncbi:MAG: molybdopterin molybdotransferase MoeA [Clostridiales Family XIII bacterium]|jgi:molybdopterin molybdotransferase/putative molybdopterin biosynthesis protein|nr:molybdopterin molybdotransferase MoeA [Clostridiales Family XIII bacterium]
MKKRILENSPTRGEVLAKLFAVWQAPVRTEFVSTKDAIGRVLAADAVSLIDDPVVRASKMDGVAVKSEAFKAGIPDASAWALGRDYVRADTGDDFDDAFDAVIAVEEVEFLAGGGLRFLPDTEPVTSGTNVLGTGEKITRGLRLAPKGTRLLAADLTAIAMGAVSEIEVYRRPKAVFIPTGSELTPLGQIPARGQTVCSNTVLAEHLLAEMGAEPLIYPIVRDDPGALRDALAQAAAEADVILFSGGTSKGAEDYTHALLAERGELICHGIASAPGRPLALALMDGKPVVNLAGPPIACFCGLDWCVRAIIDSFFELSPRKRHTVSARLAESIGSPPNFELYIRLSLEKTADGYTARPLSHFGGSPADSMRAEGLYITKLIPEPTEAGDVIEVELMR